MSYNENNSRKTKRGYENSEGRKSYDKKPYTRSEKSKNVSKTVSLGKSYYYPSDKEIGHLLDVIDAIRFDKISIPVMAKKSFVFDNPDAMGFTQVGWIQSFEDNKFKISFSSNFAEKVSDNSVIVPRCRKNKDEEIDYIMSFGITGGEPIDVIDESFFGESESSEGSEE